MTTYAHDISPDVLAGGELDALLVERFGPIADPRHGTVAGYNRIPCREDCCKLAMANYKKRWAWDRDNGRNRIVSTLGTRRRVQALAVLGWSQRQVAELSGIYPPNMARLIAGETMTRAVADRVTVVYDALSMRLPTGNAQAIGNVRNRAQRNGWPPPLAWDDIDDPDETPAGTYRPTKNRSADELLGEWEHLRSLGVSTHHALQQLGVSIDAIEKAMTRRGEVA